MFEQSGCQAINPRRLDSQNPHLVFKTLQNQNIWASYDTLEKLSFGVLQKKLQSREKACKSFRLYTYTVRRLAWGIPSRHGL